MFLRLKVNTKPRGRKVAVVKELRKVVWEECRLDMKKYTFSQRVINKWNGLSNNCVNTSLNVFKIKLTYIR